MAEKTQRHIEFERALGIEDDAYLFCHLKKDEDKGEVLLSASDDLLYEMIVETIKAHPTLGLRLMDDLMAALASDMLSKLGKDKKETMQ